VDERTPDQILADVADEAKAAFNPELDFFERRADHGDHDFYEFSKRYLQWVEAWRELRSQLQSDRDSVPPISGAP
jgi:hypothetical protein